METVKLSSIVMKLTPELYPFLRKNELEIPIVLANGFEALEAGDAMEIVQYSISEYQKDAFLQ